MGRHIYAIGGNVEASRYSGLRLGRILIGVYALSGLTAAIAAFVGTRLLWIGEPAGDADGVRIVRDCIGGGRRREPRSGGKGSAINAMLGAILIVLIRQAIRQLHFDQNYEWIIIGSAIVIAVVLDQFNARLTAKRLTKG